MSLSLDARKPNRPIAPLRACFVMVLFALLGACGAVAGPRHGAPIAPLHPKVYAAHGSPMVFRVTIDAGRLSGVTGAAVPIDLDDGRRVSGILLSLSQATIQPTRPAQWWLGPLTSYSVRLWTPPVPGVPADTGDTYLYLDLPIDAVGQGFWMEGARIEPVWLPDPSSIARGRTAAEFDPPFGILREDAQLTAMLDYLGRSPVTRWRARLLRDGLRPAPLRARQPIENVRADLFAPEVMDAIAHQHEAFWQVALARLWVLDPELSRRVRQRLVMVATVGGRRVPAWITDESALAQLRDAFLDPRLPDAGRLSRARLFLGQTPQVASWVVADPAASVGAPRASLAVLNLTGEGSMAWVSAPAGEMELATCYDRETSIVWGRAAEPSRPSTPGQITTVEANLGSWRMRHMISLTPLPVEPPGLALTPMYADWTLGALLGSGAFAVPPRYVGGTAALLTRSSPSPGGGERWSLLLECTRPQQDMEDVVSIWIGPAGDSRHVIEVRPDGSVHDVLLQTQSSTPVMTSGSTWLCSLELPEGSVGSDGKLLLAVVRRLGDGRRTSYPRPMLPWQDEPARAALTTTTWSPIGDR